ncbi:hypothetical protein Taro_012505 [Colocasia esculenta]|uniref:Uncharacterized protein n=1 Tax=Colocasia esculenta TaxID=4460 RepID=A0A843UCZ4_COLES|nr:hypothetical protein [Colocasia esculenta]
MDGAMLAFALRSGFFFLFFFFRVSAASASNRDDQGGDDLQTYVVFVDRPPDPVGFASADARQNWYESFLSKATSQGTNTARSRLVYSYGEAISGFAARLSAAELRTLQQTEGFVAAFPDRVLPLLTTRSPSFMGLNLAHGRWSKLPNSGDGVIIGMLDTGVASDHPSFSGAGMPPPPEKWKGRCEVNQRDCNNKLIGYKVFLSSTGNSSGPTGQREVDPAGHGTHTASTAAGAPVEGASVLGYANGTAVGTAPRAHLAIYKVCTMKGCSYADLIGGVDAAVQDGVDVISASIGFHTTPLHEDPLAVGSFRAAQKGVFLSYAGCNNGPNLRTVCNEAPWVLTVAASTIDRRLRTAVRLGDGQEFDGESVLQPGGAAITDLHLVYPRDGGNNFCHEEVLSRTDVKGKVVLCDRDGFSNRTAKAEAIWKAGGVGMILANREIDASSIVTDVYPIPAANLGFSEGSKVKAYINSSHNPTVSIISKGTVLGTSPSPVISSFSSRGPSLASPGILKPDVTGPGVNIFAAWPFRLGNAPDAKFYFNIMSGTSMSTPHLSGIAALVKSAHPDWSPAAIKSAIMTTADVLDHGGKPIVDETLQAANIFAVGAGHVNPARSVDPGLVYDLQPDAYIAFLCRLPGYTEDMVKTIVGRRIRCSDWKGNATANSDLNYPSISVSLRPGDNSVEVHRTVTNVGKASSLYTAKVEQPAGVRVTVTPGTLRFSKVNEKLTFTVSFSRDGPGPRDFSDGHLIWVSEKLVVRSPISVSGS